MTMNSSLVVTLFLILAPSLRDNLPRKTKQTNQLVKVCGEETSVEPVRIWIKYQGGGEGGGREELRTFVCKVCSELQVWLDNICVGRRTSGQGRSRGLGGGRGRGGAPHHRDDVTCGDYNNYTERTEERQLWDKVRYRPW